MGAWASRGRIGNYDLAELSRWAGGIAAEPDFDSVLASKWGTKMSAASDLGSARGSGEGFAAGSGEGIEAGYG
mgnify:CR=1 FL=1